MGAFASQFAIGLTPIPDSLQLLGWVLFPGLVNCIIIRYTLFYPLSSAVIHMSNGSDNVRWFHTILGVRIDKNPRFVYYYSR